MLGKKKKQVKRLLPQKAEIIEEDEYEDDEEDYEEEEMEVPQRRPQKLKKNSSQSPELRNQEVLDVIEGNLNRALSALQFLRGRI